MAFPVVNRGSGWRIWRVLGKLNKCSKRPWLPGNKCQISLFLKDEQISMFITCTTKQWRSHGMMWAIALLNKLKNTILSLEESKTQQVKKLKWIFYCFMKIFFLLPPFMKSWLRHCYNAWSSKNLVICQYFLRKNLISGFWHFHVFRLDMACNWKKFNKIVRQKNCYQT